MLLRFPKWWVEVVGNFEKKKIFVYESPECGGGFRDFCKICPPPPPPKASEFKKNTFIAKIIIFTSKNWFFYGHPMVKASYLYG